MRQSLKRALYKSLLLTLLFAFFSASAGCGQGIGWSAVEESIHSNYPDVRQLSTDSLAAWLEKPSTQQPLLLDVRQEKEYRVSHLQDATQVDPDTDDLSFLNGTDKGAPIVAYCSVGYRSSGLSDRLTAAGYTNVWNLEGSIFQWANEGRPVYRDGRPVAEVHPYNRLWGTLLTDSLRAYEPAPQP